MDTIINGLGINIGNIKEKVDKIVDYSKKIEEQSIHLVDMSNISSEKTNEAVKINTESKEMAIKTRTLMASLVGIVEELDEYLQ
jgi:hypothetical protein